MLRQRLDAAVSQADESEYPQVPRIAVAHTQVAHDVEWVAVFAGQWPEKRARKGDVFGWYTVNPPSGCAADTWDAEARAVAESKGVSLDEPAFAHRCR